jgi:acyl-coenzyme A thioesterase PaaI-like protein
MDSAAGCAVLSVTPEGYTIATLDLRIDYLQPAIAEQDMRGFAECYKRTRNLAFVRGIAYHEDRSNPIANFTACFMSRSGNLMPGMEWPDK